MTTMQMRQRLQDGGCSGRRLNSFPLVLTRLLLVLSVASCSNGGDSDTFTSRDSLGITIADNVSTPEADAPFWYLSDSPTFDVGLVEGDDEYQLFRVVGAASLDDGHIVIANSGTSELRFFNERGIHVRSVGSRGGGPGEFELMWTIARYRGDSLAVYDRRLARISVFDSQGNFARVFRLRSDYPTAVLGLLANGEVLAAVENAGEESSNGVRRSLAEYTRFSPDGEPVRSLGRFFEGEMFMMARGGVTGASQLAYGKQGLAAVRGDRFYYGSTERYEIMVYDTVGVPLQVIRRDLEPAPVTGTEMQAYKDAVTANRRDRTRLQGLLDMIDAMPVPETMPVFEAMMVDAEGNLWVRDYRRLDGDVPPHWAVFNPDGRMMGFVDTPVGFTIYEIGSDYMLGRERDEWDAQHVRVYELIKTVGE
jgi:hypothetical protein